MVLHTVRNVIVLTLLCINYDIGALPTAYKRFYRSQDNKCVDVIDASDSYFFQSDNLGEENLVLTQLSEVLEQLDNKAYQVPIDLLWQWGKSATYIYNLMNNGQESGKFFKDGVPYLSKNHFRNITLREIDDRMPAMVAFPSFITCKIILTNLEESGLADERYLSDLYELQYKFISESGLDCLPMGHLVLMHDAIKQDLKNSVAYCDEQEKRVLQTNNRQLSDRWYTFHAAYVRGNEQLTIPLFVQKMLHEGKADQQFLELVNNVFGEGLVDAFLLKQTCASLATHQRTIIVTRNTQAIEQALTVGLHFTTCYAAEVPFIVQQEQQEKQNNEAAMASDNADEEMSDTDMLNMLLSPQEKFYRDMWQRLLEAPTRTYQAFNNITDSFTSLAIADRRDAEKPSPTTPHKFMDASTSSDTSNPPA